MVVKTLLKGAARTVAQKSADKLTTKNPKHKIFKGTYHYQPTAKEIDRSLKRITKLNKKK